MAEAGLPGVEVTSWYAFMLPGGATAVAVSRLREHALKALGAPDVQHAMARQGLDPDTSTPQELASRIRRESKTWAEVIKAANIRAE